LALYHRRCIHEIIIKETIPKPNKNTDAILMPCPIKLISTDFDGTLFAEFENPPVPLALQAKLAELQALGCGWIINTGRDLSSLMEAMARAHLKVKPDYIVVVEREIYRHDQISYVEHKSWNDKCRQTHAELFQQIKKDLPGLLKSIRQRFNATIYEDVYSPFCLIAETAADAEAIHLFLDDYCGRVDGLVVVRNDVYARFSHVDFSKGTALREIARLYQATPAEIMAAGDHLNDLSMLRREIAECLVAPANAIQAVNSQVRSEGGWISDLPCGHGVLAGIRYWLEKKSGHTG